MSDQTEVQNLKLIANNLRAWSVKATNASNSGHPTSCASGADIVAVLFNHVMKYKIKDPRNPNNDRFILSKGHAAPLLYAAWAEVGLFPHAELLNLRKIDNDLEGHPTPRLPFVDVATGSLGQGLSVAAGMAYTGKYLEEATTSPYRVFCLIGDGESAEGSIWEALSFSSHYKLDNLVAIFDINRLGQSEPTALQHQVEVYAKRLEAFGCHAIIVDGHDIAALVRAFREAETVKDKPTALVCRTYKGFGLGVDISDNEGWHGKPLGGKAEEALNGLQLPGNDSSGAYRTLCLPSEPTSDLLEEIDLFGKVTLSEPPAYQLGQQVATRQAYGTALVKLAKACPRVIGLDGDTKNSTMALGLAKAFPERFVECFIAEQNLIGVGVGCACRQRAIPFVSTFAAFLSRGADQLRMAAISQTNANFVGSHVGVSIGEDGPSQMALEDLAMFRAIPTCTVFYPSDAVSAERAVEIAANTCGMCFIRTGRPNHPVIYANDAQFAVGKLQVVASSAKDQVLIVGGGVTLHEAVKAQQALAASVPCRVVDLFTIKPVDVEGLVHHANECQGRVITVEDHYPEGGIGDAVLSSIAGKVTNLKYTRLAVNGVPRSGKPNELLAMFKIDADAIVQAVKTIIA